jgi:glycosyltransferase involved in cell wall biosynthesis
MSDGVSFVYAEILELPRPQAHALQILRTAEALARAGAEVHAWARLEERLDLGRALEEILGRPPPASLRVHGLLACHKGLAGLVYRTRLFARLARPGASRTVFLGRSRRHTLALLRARRLLGSRARVVYEFHNVESELAREAGEAVRAAEIAAEEREIAARADGLWAIGRPLADDVARLLAPPRPPAVIEDGVDVACFRGAGERALTRTETTTLLYAGSLHAHKGVDDLLAALALLPEDVRLRIVGGHPAAELERLRRAAAAAGLGERVCFTGLVPPADVRRHMEASDLILLPAGRGPRGERYTSPLKLFEAMASGVPIVAAPTPALTSILADGSTAFLASGSDAAALARAVERARAGRAEARAVGRAAAAAADAYDWSRRARRILAFVAALSASPTRRSHGSGSG